MSHDDKKTTLLKLKRLLRYNRPNRAFLVEKGFDPMDFFFRSNAKQDVYGQRIEDTFMSYCPHSRQRYGKKPLKSTGCVISNTSTPFPPPPTLHTPARVIQSEKEREKEQTIGFCCSDQGVVEY